MILLASNSPRRRQLMALGGRLVGWDFAVRPVDVDESPWPGEAPADYVRRLARSKAAAAAAAAPAAEAVVAADTTVAITSDHQPEDVMGAADTTVAITSDHQPEDVMGAADTTVAVTSDNQPEDVMGAADTAAAAGNGAGRREEILGKPASPAEAEAMLRLLRGRTHRVYTGLAVWRSADGQLLEDLCETRVTMRDYSDEELQAYIDTGDPLDKAGAYAIQHAVFNPVASLEGCYANVVGLPLCALARLLARAGVASPVEADLAVACQSELQTRCPFYPIKERLDTPATEL